MIQPRTVASILPRRPECGVRLEFETKKSRLHTCACTCACACVCVHVHVRGSRRRAYINSTEYGI